MFRTRYPRFMRLFLIAGRGLLAAVLLMSAVQAISAEPLSSQRRLFRDALGAAQRGDLDNRQAALRQLQTYPLYNYLSAADLRYQLDHGADAALDGEIAGFIDAHPDLPPAQRLRRNWLSSLARRNRWQMLLDYSRDSDGATAACRAVHARIELGQNPRDAALAEWRVGRSRPDACDPVFAWLQEQGLLTPQEILGRARLAVLAGRYGLTRYLAKKLPDDLAAVTDQWLSVARTPSSLRQSRRLDGDIAVYAFKRLALRDLDAAADLLPVLAERLDLNAAQRYEARRYVALLYAQNHEPQALAWFARIDHARMGNDEHALGWQIRAAVYQQRWPLVIDAIRALPPALAKDEEWRYWQARALAETGHDGAAETIFAPLARERSYHGYLAADALGREYSLNERPLPKNEPVAARVETKPALARAREWRALGRVHKAAREWNAVVDGLDQAELAQAARIAYQWQWYSRAIITLARADYWDDLDIRYPVPYAAAVRKFAQSNDLDPAYVLAIMRTESLFQPEIRSSAGAVGLMQLLPGTARLVARKLGADAPSTQALTVPEINIQLGSRYLADMLGRWQNNIALASASYNAGPGRIARWLPATAMDPAIWIANIPYTQTRHYVQRAMSHMTVFQQRLHEDIVPLDTRIDAIQSDYADRKNR